MKKTSTMIIYVVLLAMPGPAGAQSGISVAVLSFENTSDNFSLDNLEKSVPEMLKTELSHSLYLQVLERSKLEGVFEELALAQTGMLDESTAKQIGELSGAEYIIQGQISRPSSGLRVDAHIVKVSTGRVVGEKVTGRDAGSLGEMMKVLANNIVYDLTGNGNYTQRLRITRYPTLYFAGLAAATGIATLTTHVGYKNEYDSYHAASSLAEFDRFYEKASDYRTARNILLGATAAFAVTTLILTAADRAPSNFIFASRERKGSTLVVQPAWIRGGFGVRATVVLK